MRIKRKLIDAGSENATRNHEDSKTNICSVRRKVLKASRKDESWSMRWAGEIEGYVCNVLRNRDTY